MIDAEALVGLDIETTGLDPDEERVLAAALAAANGTRVLVSDDESHVLTELERLVFELPSEAAIVTWNGGEFDMPFLATRFRLLHLASTLQVTPTPDVGKYGRPFFHAEWGSHRHLDIAPRFKNRAQSLGVSWNLKPVASVVLGVTPVEVDRSGSAIARLDPEELARYVASDADITRRLAMRLTDTLEPA
jgi:DNA polymerase elongation subunit (family B)